MGIPPTAMTLSYSIIAVPVNLFSQILPEENQRNKNRSVKILPIWLELLSFTSVYDP